MYKVIQFFTDLQDGEHPYEAGDTFPREGMDVSEGRLTELAGAFNRQGAPLIEEEQAPAEKPKRTRKKAAE